VSAEVRGQKGGVDIREHLALARHAGDAELSERQPKSRLLVGKCDSEDDVVASADQDATQHGRAPDSSAEVSNDVIHQARAVRFDGDPSATAQPPEHGHGQSLP
jgi:hypothetical protein